MPGATHESLICYQYHALKASGHSLFCQPWETQSARHQIQIELALGLPLHYPQSVPDQKGNEFDSSN